MHRGILIVDDDDQDPAVRYLMNLAESLGARFSHAKTAVEALRELRASPFQCMFLDLDLGSSISDGIFLMDQMKEENLHIPVHIVSHVADLDFIRPLLFKYTFVQGDVIPKQRIDAYHDLLQRFATSANTIKYVASTSGRAVFIIHGRDPYQLKRFVEIVRNLGLEAIVLGDAPRRGSPTIIQAFEENASKAIYGIGLLTTDDVGSLKSETCLQPRARQNVIFEVGYLFAKLGRERIALFVDPSIELPSDLDGIFYMGFDCDDHELERYLIKQLQSVGIEFQLR